MPKLDLESIRRRVGTSYPAPFDQPCLTRVRRALGDAGGLGDFGVNLLELPPGTWSSQRHWHSNEDEFVWVLSAKWYWSRMAAKRSCAPAIAPRLQRTAATGIT